MYTEVILGSSPILLTVPHDGGIKIPGAAVRKEAAPRDEHTREFTLSCASELSRLGVQPTVIIFTLDRSHVDANRSPRRNPFAPGFEEHYQFFHAAIDDSVHRALQVTARYLHIDLHAYVNSPGPEDYDMVIGSKQHKTCPRGSDKKIAEMLGREYRAVFSPDPLQRIDSRFSGGWISCRTGKTYGFRGLDSFQLELNATTCLDSSHRMKTSIRLAHTLAECM